MKEENNTKKHFIHKLFEMRKQVGDHGTLDDEYKQAEKILSDAEEICENFYRSNPHPMWIYDLENLTFLDVNHAAVQHYGYSQEEFLSMTIKDIRPPEDIPALLENVSKVTEGLDVAGRWRHIKKDGTVIDVEIISHTLTFAGRPAELVLANDITERKRAEEALRESEEKYKTLAENSLTGIFIHQDGKFVFVNNRFAEMHGYEPEELLGKNHLLLIHPDDRNGVSEMALKRIRGGVVPERYEIRRVRKDDKTIWCEMMATNVQYRGKPAIMGNIIEITERRLAEEAKKTSEEQLRSLTAYLQKMAEMERTNIAREIHDELGQALTVLKMDISWLKKRIPGDEEPLTKKTASILKLIDKTIQTVKKIASDLRPGLLDDLGLSSAIEWQMEEFQKRTGIKCNLTMVPQDISLDRDRNTAIFRIFQETLTNVARHSEATEVIVRLQEKDGHVELQIQDNGRGITEQDLAHPESLGLLGIRERAKIFGGGSIIEGVPGQGTKVTVSIPVHD